MTYTELLENIAIRYISEMVDPENPLHIAILESADTCDISIPEVMELLEATNRVTSTKSPDMLDDGHNLQGDRLQYKAYKDDRKEKKKELQEAFKSLPKEETPTLKGKAKKLLQTSVDFANNAANDLTTTIDRASMHVANKANIGRAETQAARQKDYEKYTKSKKAAAIAISSGTVWAANTVLVGPFQIAFDAAFAANCPELKELATDLKKKAESILKSKIPDSEKKEKYNMILNQLDTEVRKVANAPAPATT